MADAVYKQIEVTGTSSEGTDDAIRKAIARAAKTVHGMKWFEVVETRGAIDGANVKTWQVTVKVGFHLDE